MLWAYSLLGAGVLGNSLGSLRDSVLGKLSWKEKPDSSLDLPGGDGGPLVVMGEPAGLSGNALEQVVDKGVHDAHGLGRNTSVRVNLLEDLVDVDSIGFLPPLVLLLLVSLGDSLGGFASGFGSFSRSLRGHVDGIVAQVNCLPGPGEPLFLSTFGTTAGDAKAAGQVTLLLVGRPAPSRSAGIKLRPPLKLSQFCLKLPNSKHHHVWTWQRRQGQGKGKVQIQPCWTPVPRWAYPPSSPQG